jgi:hypothetical protein
MHRGQQQERHLDALPELGWLNWGHFRGEGAPSHLAGWCWRVGSESVGTLVRTQWGLSATHFIGHSVGTQWALRCLTATLVFLKGKTGRSYKARFCKISHITCAASRLQLSCFTRDNGCYVQKRYRMGSPYLLCQPCVQQLLHG